MKRFFIGFLSTIGALVLLIALSITALLFYRQAAEVPEDTVLMLNFGSELAEHTGSGGLAAVLSEPKYSLKHVVDAIDAAGMDDRVIGIVARLDHAGMGIAQAQEIRDAVMRFRAASRDKGKFTIAYADTFGELGPGTLQYYLATSFDEIWLQPIGIVGLTGLVFEVPFAREALEKLHLKPRIDRRKEYKSYSEMFTENDFTPPGKEALKAVIDSIMGQIVKDIAVSRELSEADTLDIIDHAPLLGQEAHKQGLVDKIAYFDEVEKFIEEKTGREEYAPMSPQKYLKLNPKPPLKRGDPKIALIYGTGDIYRDSSDKEPGLFNPAMMGGNQLSHAFQRAIDDPDVKAIVFRINSGGGSAVASETIWRATLCAKEAGKPVIVSMSDLAGSGGYWIAASATKIVAQPGTITGSIGVLGGKILTKGLWEQLGVNWGEMHKGANATMWSNTQDYTPQEWERLQAWLDEIYAAFILKVSEGRKLSLEHVGQIAKGRIWSGEDALKFGLVDKLGGLHTAIELAKIEINMQDMEVPVQIFPEPENITDKLLRLLINDDDDNKGLIASVNIYNQIPGLKNIVNLFYALERTLFSGAQTVEMPVRDVRG